MAAQLVASRAVLSSTELVSACRPALAHIIIDPRVLRVAFVLNSEKLVGVPLFVDRMPV
jgi:hypothetical protein